MQLRELYSINVLAMEYPGYGFFTHAITDSKQTSQKLSPSPGSITENSNIVMKHVLASKEEGGLGFSQENVIIFGRSIGTGPATTMASTFKPGALVIMSPYTTIKDVTANVAGRFLSMFISNHFNNRSTLAKVTCPVLLIHGKKDTLIPSSHSEALYKVLQDQQSNNKILNCSHLNKCKKIIHPHMTHNDFNLIDDILLPIQRFLENVYDNKI
jgi:fermentation-respiration switch protein FrsA (DUF1100 family)